MSLWSPENLTLSLIPASPDLSFELPLWSAGLTRVAGLDEAGRGALAARYLLLPSYYPPIQKY